MIHYIISNEKKKTKRVRIPAKTLETIGNINLNPLEIRTTYTHFQPSIPFNKWL